jgi:RNA polymerase subunit RPABC4/transcription elongation factor Spt4
MNAKTLQCPNCNTHMEKPFVAISRRDNKTQICPPCGRQEAMEDIMKSLQRRG